MTSLKLKRTALTALSFAFAASLAVTPTLAEAQKQRPKTTAASASPKKPNAQKGKGKVGSAGSTQGSATANPARPNTNRNRAGYILEKPNARKVRFKRPSKSQRTAASMLRRKGRGNKITKLGTATVDKRSAAKREALAAKQAQRDKPRISPTSTAALREAAANGFKPTAASRGAIRAGAAPIGSGQVQNPSRRQWNELAAQTAQRKGLPEPKPSILTRIWNGFKGLFKWS